MVIEDKKLFFRTARVFFDDALAASLAQSGRYGRIISISRSKSPPTKAFSVLEKVTPIIELQAPVEEIFSHFNETARNRIRRADRSEGFEIYWGKPTDASYELYRAFERAQERVPYPRSYFSEHIFVGGMICGELCAGVYVVPAFPHLYIDVVFSKRLFVQDKKAYSMVSNISRRIIWELVVRGKEQRYEDVNLTYVNLSDKQKAGITDYKLSFGGVLRTEYIYTYTSSFYRMFEYVARVRNRLGQLIRRLFRIS